MKKILLTRGVSNNIWLIEKLQSKGFEVVLSHSLEEWKGKSFVVETIQEPKNLKNREYLKWLESIIAFIDDISYIIPGSNLESFIYLDEFKKIKDKVILGSAIETIKILDNKSYFYSECLKNKLNCSIPFKTYNNYESFIIAKENMIKMGYHELCIKPSVGVFASGFHYFSNEDILKRFTQGSNFAVTYNEYENALKNSDYVLPEMIIMPKYNGKEISVDGSCNIYNGNIAMCARVKIPSVGQKIIIDDEIYKISRKIIDIFKLKGVFNIQFMIHDDKYKILEVNARPSGGIFYSEKGGVSLIENLFDNINNIYPLKEKIVYE